MLVLLVIWPLAGNGMPKYVPKTSSPQTLVYDLFLVYWKVFIILRQSEKDEKNMAIHKDKLISFERLGYYEII